MSTTLTPRPNMDTADARQAIECALDTAERWADRAEHAPDGAGVEAARLVRGFAQSIEDDIPGYLRQAEVAELGGRALALLALVRRLSL